MTAATKLHLQGLLVSLECELQARGWWEQLTRVANLLSSLKRIDTAINTSQLLH